VDFRFHGGRVSVNFTATVGKRWCDGGFERLGDPAALGRWFTEAGLTEHDPHCSPADLRHARHLREASYRLMLARMDRGQPSPDDVATVNVWAAEPAPGTELQMTAAGLRAHLVRVTTPALLAQIARDAVDVIGSTEGQRLRECANPECSLLFVDTSRAGTRRWCSMSACGSRDKMARYRSENH
jgi:predicted RNA-binding Zn ribbon-like protein